MNSGASSQGCIVHVINGAISQVLIDNMMRLCKVIYYRKCYMSE